MRVTQSLVMTCNVAILFDLSLILFITTSTAVVLRKSDPCSSTLTFLGFEFDVLIVSQYTH